MRFTSAATRVLPSLSKNITAVKYRCERLWIGGCSGSAALDGRGEVTHQRFNHSRVHSGNQH